MGRSRSSLGLGFLFVLVVRERLFVGRTDPNVGRRRLPPGATASPLREVSRGADEEVVPTTPNTTHIDPVLGILVVPIEGDVAGPLEARTRQIDRDRDRDLELDSMRQEFEDGGTIGEVPEFERSGFGDRAGGNMDRVVATGNRSACWTDDLRLKDVRKEITRNEAGDIAQRRLE